MKIQNPGLSPKERLLLDKLIAGDEVESTNYIGLRPELRLAIQSYQKGLEVDWKALIGVNPFIRETASSFAPAGTILPPTEISLTVLSSTEIRFDWTQAEGADGTELQYSFDGVTWEVDPHPGTTATDYTWDNLTPNTQYFFRLRSYISDPYETSAWTQTFNATTESESISLFIAGTPADVLTNANINRYYWSSDAGGTTNEVEFGTDLSITSVGVYKPTEEVFMSTLNADTQNDEIEWKNTFGGVVSGSEWTDVQADVIFKSSQDGNCLIRQTQPSVFEYYNGTTWNTITLNDNISHLDIYTNIASSSFEVQYTAVDGEIIYSSDQGANWYKLGTQPALFGEGVVAVSYYNGVLYAIQYEDLAESRTLHISYSEDQGATWSVATEDFSFALAANSEIHAACNYVAVTDGSVTGNENIFRLNTTDLGKLIPLGIDYVLPNTIVTSNVVPMLDRVGLTIMDISQGLGDPSNKTYWAILNFESVVSTTQMGPDGALFPFCGQAGA